MDPGFDAWRNEHPDSFVAGWALNWTGLPDVRSENQTWTFQFTDASPYSTYETRCQTAPPAELLPGIPHPDPGPGVACTESGPICGTLPYVQAWNERPFEIIDPMAGRAVAGSFWGPTTGEWRVCIGDNSFAMKRADVIYRIQDGAFWSLDLADPYPGYGAFPYISPHALEPTV